MGKTVEPYSHPSTHESLRRYVKHFQIALFELDLNNMAVGQRVNQILPPRSYTDKVGIVDAAWSRNRTLFSCQSQILTSLI